MRVDPQPLSRGVYRVHPDGLGGRAILYVVNSSGERIRITGELEVVEVRAVNAALWRWLDQHDPGIERRPRLEVL